MSFILVGFKRRVLRYRFAFINPRGGALGCFLGGYVPPGTPNWHPVLKKNSPKIPVKRGESSLVPVQYLAQYPDGTSYRPIKT